MKHYQFWGHGCRTSKTVRVLLIVGGLNWGLQGLGMLLGAGDSWNVVRMVLGGMPMLEAIIYVLVGIAAVMKIFGCGCGKCRACLTCEPAAPTPAQGM